MASTGPDLSAEELRVRVRELGPFHHAVDLPHGVSTYVPELARGQIERTRVSNLVQHAWPALIKATGGSLQGLRVLDVACCSGGFSVEAAKGGASHVLGIDVVESYLDQARFIKDTLGLDNVEFQNIAMEDLSPETVGTFDVSFCFGILYHLEDPVRAMKALSSVTEKVMVVDTDALRLYRGALPFLANRALWYMNVAPSAKELNTTNQWRTRDAIQFNPTPRAVEELLHYVGFDDVERLSSSSKTLEKRYRNRRRMTFVAVRK
jgi:tRNA (mo5U34)-methyltransferase